MFRRRVTRPQSESLAPVQAAGPPGVAGSATIEVLPPAGHEGDDVEPNGTSVAEPPDTEVAARVEAALAAAAAPADDEALHDERLVRAAQKGELASFNALVVRHERAVFNVCLRLLRDVGLAEDASQDTFVKAWTSIAAF